MIRRAVESVLHRAGVTGRLQRLWQRDIGRSAADAAREIKEVAKALERDRKAIAEQLKALDARLNAIERTVAGAQAANRDRAGQQVRRIGRRLRRLELVTIADAADAQAGQVDAREIARHAVDAIAAAPLVELPEAYLLVRDIFPRHFFDRLVAALPAPVFFPAPQRSKTSLRVSRSSIVPRTAREGWQTVSADVAAAIADAAQRRLAASIERRYQGWFGERAASAMRMPLQAFGARVASMRPGHTDKPHCDPKRAAVSVFVNISAAAAPESGVALHHAAQPLRPFRTTTYYPEDHGVACDLSARIAIPPNAALILLNDSAAHGSYVAADAAGTRHHTLTFYIGPRKSNLLRLVSKLPPRRQQPWLGLLTR